MREKNPHLSGFILTLVFVLSGLFLPQISHAQTPPLCTDVPGYAPLILATGDITCVPTGTPGAVEAGGVAPESGTSWWTVLSPLTWLVSAFGAVSIVILKLAQLITGLSGLVLNFVVQYSVVEMKARFDEASINDAWKVIRDVGNMGFIFVLLYAAIMTIIGQGEDNQKLIVRIVIVAILINFSLFFTKFVIDVSNILAMMFYDAIAPGSLSANATTGLSNSLMAPLKLQSILNVGNIGLQGERLLIIGVMGTIVSLIVAFVLFAISILFLIRFVVLIFVVILSPIAFISFVLPNMDKYREQWKDALLGQAFFAPIYFMLTWVVIKVSRGLLTSDGTMAEALQGAVSSTGQVGPPSSSSIGVLVNFIIMIALLIFSLVAAKEWAGKAGGQVSKLTSWATGAAGGATLGMAGRFSRNTLGAGADRLAQSERLQRWAGRSVIGQTVFRGVNRTAESSFDLRATKIGDATVGTLGAGQAHQGGQRAKIQEKTATREKFAQTLRAPARGGAPSAKESYAARISGGPITHGGTRNSGNTIFGTLGRSNRVAASKILSGQLTPLETQEQNLQNRENQLSQQLSGMNNELTTINTAVAAGTATPQQIARQAILNGPVGNRGSIAYIQDQLTTTQTNLTRVTAETTRIRALIAANQLNNPANPITNPVTGVARPARADEQNY